MVRISNPFFARIHELVGAVRISDGALGVGLSAQSRNDTSVPNGKSMPVPNGKSITTKVTKVHEGEIGFPLCSFVSFVVQVFVRYLRAATGSRKPASLASFAALSVASHVKSASLRPKWPYAAVFL